MNMSKTKNLLKIDYHTDDETGNYFIGEIDIGICGTLDTYLRNFGQKSKEDIVKNLAHLIYEVETRVRDIQAEELKGR